MARDYSVQSALAEKQMLYSTASTDVSEWYYQSSQGRSDLIYKLGFGGFRQPTAYHAHRGHVSTSSYFCLKTRWLGYSGESSPPAPENGVWAGTTGIYPEKRPQFDQNQINRVVSEATAKAVRFDMNVGTTLGELPETVGFIASSTVTVLSAFRDVMRGRFKDAAKRLGLTDIDVNSGLTPAQVWLSYKLGWAPMLQDIDSAIKLTQDQWSQKRPMSTAVRNSTFTNDWLMPNGGPYFITSEGLAETDIRCKLYYAIPDTTYSKIVALGLTNPYAVAWELVPLSFLFDWFIPVGDFLSSFTRWQGLDYVGGYYSIYNRVQCTCTYDPDHECSGNLPQYSLDNTSFQRVPLTTPPIGRIHIKLLDRLSWQRTATALSLLKVLSS